MRFNKFYLVILLLVMSSNNANSQIIDSIFSTMLRNEPIIFRYKIVVNSQSKETLTALSKNTNQYYLLNERDFNFWKMNITTSHHSLNTADSIIRNLKSNLKIDSLIEVQLRNIIDQSNQRVEVYKKSYEDAIVLAEGYSKQLGNCIELHKIKPRPRKWEAAVWGGVGGVIIGLLTGVAISR